MKKNVIVSLADANYFPLLEELINSIKQFKDSESVAICILDAGLTEQQKEKLSNKVDEIKSCLLYTSPSPRDRTRSRMPSSA